MRTVDVRLLVRGTHTAAEVLTQLLSGVLRIHGVVELLPDRRGALPNGRPNPTYGHAVPVDPVLRNARTRQYHDVAAWRGEVLEPERDHHGRPHPDEHVEVAD